MVDKQRDECIDDRQNHTNNTLAAGVIDLFKHILCNNTCDDLGLSLTYSNMHGNGKHNQYCKGASLLT